MRGLMEPGRVEASLLGVLVMAVVVAMVVVASSKGPSSSQRRGPGSRW